MATMASNQIRTLLQPPDHSASVQRAVALLNSSFTSLEQAKTGNKLSDLLAKSKASSEALNDRAQLASSQSEIDALIRDTHSRAGEQLIAAQELSLLRHSLTDELTSLSEELESTANAGPSKPTLLEEIETLHRNLKELESVKGYVEVIRTASQLSESAVKQIENAPLVQITDSSLTDYKSLQAFVASVRRACDKARDGTGQGIKLSSFLSQLLERTWLNIRKFLTEAVLSAAEKLRWPMPIDYAAAKPEVRREFENAFRNLLRLQEIGEILHAEQTDQSEGKQAKDGLYALQALIKPVALRFKYHFEGTRQTNKLDKPEWYFAHILNVSHEHRPFMEIIAQRLLQGSKYASIIAWREFTRLLLPILSRKIKHTMPALLPHPSLLAHTIYQALAADDALREAGFSLKGTFGEPADSSHEWEGTSEIILGHKEWFDAWLEGERRFGEDQYHEIISSSDAWHFSDDTDDEVVNERDVRPTVSARRLKALVEQITDRYRPLPRFLHKTRFLIAVQVPLLELYHTRISESLDAFETLSSFLLRAVPGALASQAGGGRDQRSMTTGVEGSQRLVKAYVSSKWMANVMTSWGEDLFFLELWHQICEKASLRSRVEDVDSLPDPNASKDEGTIFEELVSQYNKLAERAESMLIRQICGEVESELKPYFNRQPESEQSTNEALLSQTLLAPIARLSSHLSFLHKNLPANIVINLYRKIASHISLHILQRHLLYRGRARISASEGKVILDESNLWVETSRMALGGSMRRVEGPWEKLLEASRLLSLDGDAFQRAVNVVRVGSPREYEQFSEEAGLAEMTSDEVMDVLRVREDFPK